MRLIILLIHLIICIQSFAQEVVQINGLNGAKDKDGKLIIPAVYEHLLGFENGLSVASKSVSTGIEDDAQIRFGMINSENIPVISFKYYMLDGFNNQYAYFEIGYQSEGDKWKRGIIDRDGKEYYVAIIQNGRAKMYADETCTKLIEIIDYNIPVEGLRTGRNAKGEPVVKVRYGKKTAWTWCENVTDDNHEIAGLRELQQEWKKKLESLSTDELIELYKF